MDITAHAKSTATILATVSTLVYCSGYLVLRARARALGTDGAFTLVDQEYIFWGFRFAFITVVAVLVLAPFLLAIRWAVLWLASLPRFADLLYLAKWSLLLLLVVATLATLKILHVSGVLLQGSGEDGGASVLREAIIGERPDMSVLLTFGTVSLATLSTLWLIRVYASGDRGAFVCVLGGVVSVQIVTLPIYHGALYAGRQVRVLAGVPDVVKGLSGPLGIVDRTSKHVTLFGCDANGRRRLTTVKIDDLNGMVVEKIVSLSHFVSNDLADSAGSEAKQKDVSQAYARRQGANQPQPANEVKPMARNGLDVHRSFFTMLVEYFNLTFEGFGSLGDSAVDAGQLWSVEFDATGKPSPARRLGSLDNLAWPVLGPDASTVYALQQGRVVRLGGDGKSVETISDSVRWVKLLGVAKDGSVLGFVLKGREKRAAILPQNGEVHLSHSPLPDDEQTQISHLLQEARTYVGDKKLYVERSEHGRGFDVFLQSGDVTFNLSDGGDDRCGQASFSPDFRRVLFVRKPRS
jgi:hypothetical protein